MNKIAARWLVMTSTCCAAGGALTCGGGGDQPSSAADFEAQFTAAFCARLDGCCKAKGSSVDQALCSFAGGASAGAYVGSAKRGFDARAAADCLAAVRHWDCAETGLTLDIDRLCAMAYAGAGTAAEGDACSFDDDCAQPSGGHAVCAQSKCRAQALHGQAGDACLFSPVLSCAFEQGLTCLVPATSIDAGTCAPRVAAGHSCRFSTDCTAGLSCVGNVCVPPIPAGQPCGAPGAANCEWGTSCNTTTSVCTPVSLMGTYYCKAA